MVNAAVISDDPERALILSYAPAAGRSGLAALLALDERLGSIVRRATDPMVGLMRLTWWAEALSALDGGPPPAEPILTALAADVLPMGVSGAELAEMVDGWELLLGDEPIDEAALATFGQARGGRLFVAAATVLGAADERVGLVGEGWALADLAGRVGDRALATTAGGMAAARLAGGYRQRWPKALRSLGALGLLARSDLADHRRGAPSRVGRLLWHRLTGR